MLKYRVLKYGFAALSTMIVCRSIMHFVSENINDGNGPPVYYEDAPLDPSSFVIVQFDSRPLTNTSYWYTSAHWNWQYARRHGHRFAFYSYPSLDESSQAASADDRTKCVSHDQQSMLSDPWCKVQTMLQAQEDYPDARFFLYVDSDAVISEHFAQVYLLHLVENFRRWLNWTMEEKPIIFNQDGPSWWCNLCYRHHKLHLVPEFRHGVLAPLPPCNGGVEGVVDVFDRAV